MLHENYNMIRKLFVKSGCPYCTRAVTHLTDAGIEFEKIEVTYSQLIHLSEMSGITTVPQLFEDGKFKGDSVYILATY